MAVDRRSIFDGLKDVGLLQGDVVLVHSSLSSFGHVQGGASAVANALIEAVGPEGSVFVPTFNFGQLTYDSDTTPSLTGAISEAFRHLPGAVRSSHPTHPISGRGPMAIAVLGEHPLLHPFGPASPLWRLWERNAKVLFLGCDHRSSSMIHVAEEVARVPYLGRTRVGRIVHGRQEREVTVARPPCSRGFNAIEQELSSDRWVSVTVVGQSKIQLMQSVDVVEAALQLLHRNPASLLCNDSGCAFCRESRQMIQECPK